LIASRAAETIVCFGAEAQSKGLDLNPESAELSMLFGDGAGAVLVTRERPLEPAPGKHVLQLEDILIATDGNFAEELMVRAPGTGNGERWIDQKQLASGLHHGFMNGRSVILHAVRKLAEAAAEIVRRNGLELDQIDLVIPHQANANLLRALSKKLAINEDRIVVNVNRLGNTSGASPFLALWQAHRDERLREGAHILILAFGTGFTWGACLCRVV
jgi:3-oxoacyl-[acyl-carrier-protein] synthase III